MKLARIENDLPETVIEVITPEIASKILERNTNNRNLNKSAVAYYKEQIERGAWQVNGESIKIAHDGTLLDGQHRLRAVVESGKPIKTFVARGLSEESFKTIDAGKSRTHADYLKINGREGALSQLAAAARVAMAFNDSTGEYVYSSKKVSPTDMISYVDRHSGLSDSLSIVGENVSRVMSKSVAAGCHYIFSIVDSEAAHQFFESLGTGANLKEGSPILAVRNRLMAIRATGRAGGSHQKMVVAYLVQAFNYFLDGKTLRASLYNPQSSVIVNGLAGSFKQ